MLDVACATETFDLLFYLARSLVDEGPPVLVLLNLCAGAASYTDMQSPWLMALKRTHMPLTALNLVAFTQEETQRFVQGLAWAEQPLQVESISSIERGTQHGKASGSREALVPFANWLYFQTRGQPLYLVETLKGLLARELIRSQLARLTPSAWELLVAGAALGQGLTFERLIEVAQLDEQEGLRALEELQRNGLLCEGTLVKDPQAVDGYAFPREMLREVVYQEAGVTRQRLVQRRVSLIMQEQVGNDQDEEDNLPHPAPIDGHAPAETRNGKGRQVVAEVVSRGMRGKRWTVANDSSGVTRRHAGTGIGENTLLAEWERGATRRTISAFSRSPPSGPV